MNRLKELYRQSNELGLKFLLIGGHAVGQHGYGRMTEDVDLLICADDKAAWHQFCKPSDL